MQRSASPAVSAFHDSGYGSDIKHHATNKSAATDIDVPNLKDDVTSVPNIPMADSHPESPDCSTPSEDKVLNFAGLTGLKSSSNPWDDNLFEEELSSDVTDSEWDFRTDHNVGYSTPPTSPESTDYDSSKDTTPARAPTSCDEDVLEDELNGGFVTPLNGVSVPTKTASSESAPEQESDVEPEPPSGGKSYGRGHKCVHYWNKVILDDHCMYWNVPKGERYYSQSIPPSPEGPPSDYCYRNKRRLPIDTGSEAQDLGDHICNDKCLLSVEACAAWRKAVFEDVEKKTVQKELPKIELTVTVPAYNHWDLMVKDTQQRDCIRELNDELDRKECKIEEQEEELRDSGKAYKMLMNDLQAADAAERTARQLLAKLSSKSQVGRHSTLSPEGLHRSARVRHLDPSAEYS